MTEVDKQKRERVSQRVKELRQKATVPTSTLVEKRRPSTVSDFSPISSNPPSGAATPTQTPIDQGQFYQGKTVSKTKKVSKIYKLNIFSISNSFIGRPSLETIEEIWHIQAKQFTEVHAFFQCWFLPKSSGGVKSSWTIMVKSRWLTFRRLGPMGSPYALCYTRDSPSTSHFVL